MFIVNRHLGNTRSSGAQSLSSAPKGAGEVNNGLSINMSLLTERGHDLIKDFRKLVNTFPAGDPFSGHQSSGSKSFTRSRYVRDANLVGHRVKSQPVRAGNVTGARRGNRNVSSKIVLDDLLKLQCRSGRRVTFSFVMRLFDEPIIIRQTAK